jgi:mRNA degradation ribonuclease J1/J2
MQFYQLHASNHLNRQQIGQVINEIDAKRVFPVHTENEALFKKISRKVCSAKLRKENQA